MVGLNSYLFRFKKAVAKRDFILACIIGITIILTGTFFGWYNNKVVIHSPSNIARYTLEPHNKLSFLSNWDGPDYIHIATLGYTSNSYENFFPLYPLLVHLVNQIISSPLISALIVSWISIIFAIYFYLKITKLIFKNMDNYESIRALLFFVLFPTAIFYFATFTEGLLAAIALAAIYLAIKKRFYFAALVAMFGSATHITGEFVVLLIMMMAWENKHSIKRFISVGIIGSLGLVSYSYYLLEKFNEPFGFITAQENHGWVNTSYSHMISTIDLFNIIFIILILLTAVFWWFRKRSFAIYSLLFLLIPIVGKQFGGFNRYVLMIFPMQFMLFGYLRKRTVLYPLVIAIFAISWTYFLLQYAGGYIGG